MRPSITTLWTVVKDATLPARVLDTLITQLIRTDATKSASVLLKLARFQHRNQPAVPGESTTDGPKPTGPFTVDNKRPCALLIYVPRNIKSRLIDDGTGGYGYSHVTIDCAEVDEPTGKPIMTESTTQDVVHRSFQDHYGSRPFVRIVLSSVDLDRGKFRKCVNDKLGEPYDDKEALTWGAVDDPAKQICSDLAGDCLPDEVRDAIMRARLEGRLRRLSVSVHRRFRKTAHVFISPNGFAEYFGAPHGSQVVKPDTPVTSANVPKTAQKSKRSTSAPAQAQEPPAGPAQPAADRQGHAAGAWKISALLLTLVCIVLIAWLLCRLPTVLLKAEAK